MSIRTSLSDLFDVEHPVLLAPMAGVSGGALAAAVSGADGLGLIGGGFGDADWLAHEFDATGDARTGAGFVTWSLARQPHLLDLVLERSPTVLMFSFGDFQPFLPRIRDRQTKLIVQMQTLDQASEVVDAGVDAIVAQGTEARFFWCPSEPGPTRWKPQGIKTHWKPLGSKAHLAISGSPAARLTCLMDQPDRHRAVRDFRNGPNSPALHFRPPTETPRT